MWDDEPSEEKLFRARKENAQQTAAVIAAVEKLRTRDFTRMMGSGILVSLVDLQGEPITAEFCIAAEDMQEIAPLIVESLVKSLKLRKALRAAELREITNAIESAAGG